MGFISENGIRAVAFDIDGTLYPIGQLNRMLFITAFPNLSFAIRYNRMRKQVREEDGYADFPATGNPAFQERAYSIMYPHGLKGGIEEFRRRERKWFHEKWERMFFSFRSFPGMKECLEEVAEQCDIAVLTDFPLGTKLKALGIEHLPKYAESAENLGHLKPSACCFRSIMEGLGGDLKPSEVLYVGDSERKDIKGASSYGMRTCLIGGSEKKRKESKADVTVADFTEFRKKVL